MKVITHKIHQMNHADNSVKSFVEVRMVAILGMQMMILVVINLSADALKVIRK